MWNESARVSASATRCLKYHTVFMLHGANPRLVSTLVKLILRSSLVKDEERSFGYSFGSECGNSWHNESRESHHFPHLPRPFQLRGSSITLEGFCFWRLRDGKEPQRAKLAWLEPICRFEHGRDASAALWASTAHS